MGNILQQLRYWNKNKANLNKLKTNYLLDIQQTKLKEYYGSFKQICDTFSIGQVQFDQIFNTTDEVFRIWDKDDEGQIDSLELFSGIILFSSSSFEDKMKFMFDIFDFNELRYLTIYDFEFILLCCINSTFKILGLKDCYGQEKQISSFLNQYFTDQDKITLQKLKRWCQTNIYINQFFQLINKDINFKNVNTMKLDLKEFNLQKKIQSKVNKQDSKEMIKNQFEHGLINEPLKYNNLYTQPLKEVLMRNQQVRINQLKQYQEKLYKQEQNNKSDIIDIEMKIEWVYGYRNENTNNSIIFIPSQDSEHSQQKLIYFSSNIIIIFYPNLNKQDHYLMHENLVLTVTLASESSLIASGEQADQPAIHIWDHKTLKNVGIIKGQHQKAVHLLRFLHKDLYLASSEIRDNSPINIYNLKDFSLLLSAYVNGLSTHLFNVQNLDNINEFKITNRKMYKDDDEEQKNKNQIFEDTVVLLTRKSLHQISYYDGHFHMKETMIDKHGIDTDIVNGISYQIDNDFYIVTVHQSGIIIIWKNFEYYDQVVYYQTEIQNIIIYKEKYILLSTSKHFLHIWDIEFKDNIMNLDVKIDLNRTFSQSLKEIVTANFDLIVTTKEGDVLKLELDIKNQSINTYRYDQITQIQGQQHSMSQLQICEDRKFISVAGTNKMIYTFDTASKQLVDIFIANDSVNSIDYYHQHQNDKLIQLQIIGCRNGHVCIRQNFEKKPSQQVNLEAHVNTVKFSQNGEYLMVLTNQALAYLFKAGNEFKYFSKQPLKFRFDNEDPISGTFLDDNFTFIIGTSNRSQYIFTMDELKGRNVIKELKPIKLDKWNLYTIDQDNSIKSSNNSNQQQNLSFKDNYTQNPAILGCETKILAFSDNYGFIYFFKNLEQMKKLQGGYLNGHNKQISQLQLSDDQQYLFSLGKSDQTMIQWKISYIDDNDYFNDVNQQVGQTRIEYQAKKLREKSQQCLLREIYFCQQLMDNSIKKDNYVSFKEVNKGIIKKILDRSCQKFSVQEQIRNRRAPPVSVQLEYILGFQCYEQRKTLFYVHNYETLETEKEERESSKDQYIFEKQKDSKLIEIDIPEYIHKDMLLTSKDLIEYDVLHENCQRSLIYMVSRLVVILDPISRRQKFYEGHKNVISCIHVHPSKSLVISGECCLYPQIHIWNSQSRENIKRLNTLHKSGIMKLSMNRSGNYIVSVSSDKYYSIQITDWKFDEIICFRNTSECPIFDVCFNPYDQNIVVTAGYQNLQMWRIQGRSLIKQQIIQLGSNVVITCLEFINYNLGNHIQSDLVCGNTEGDLSIVVHGKYIPCQQKAHSKTINIIKITQIQKNATIIISAAEDEKIKIWDTSFNILSQIDVRSIEFVQQFDLDKIKNLSAQSIDIFCCEQNCDNQIGYLLIGTRNGQIVETGLKIEREKLEQLNRLTVKKHEKYKLIQSIEYEHNQIMKFHHSQNINNYNSIVNFCIHKDLYLMFTIGQDYLLYIWDLRSFKTIYMKALEFVATCIKLLISNNLLIIGYTNGTFQVLEFQVDEGQMELDSLKIIYQDNSEKNTSIVNINISKDESLIAVSYIPTLNNVKMINGFIHLFELDHQNKVFNKNRNRVEVKMEYSSDDKLIKKGYYYFEISECNKQLIVYNQLFDQNNIQINNDLQGKMHMFQIDCDEIEIINAFAKIQNTKWNSLKFPNQMIGQYQYFDNIDQKNEKEMDVRFSELEVINNLNLGEKYLILGSTQGDIVVFRNHAVFGDKIANSDCNDHLGKTYSAHCSFINQIVNLDNKCIFTSGIQDQCIMRWRLIIDQQDIDKDYNIYDINQNNELNQQLNMNKFKNDISNVLPLRKELREVKEQIDESQQPEYEIHLLNCIGRKAYNTRNNLFYDFDDRIIYIAGCNLIITDYNKEVQQYQYQHELDVTDGSGTFRNENRNIQSIEHVKQEFINIDQYDQHSISPQIQTITLSENSKYLAAGTYQLEAKILVWDICSFTCLYSVVLKESVKITHITFAFDNVHILVIGITQKFHQILYLINIQNQDILGQSHFKYSSVHRYQDIKFFNSSISQFGLCGDQVMQIWQYKGQNLSYYNLKYDNIIYNSIYNVQQDNSIIFMSLIFIQNTIVTAGNDGFLYLWDYERLVNKQQAHPNSVILCLYENQKGTQFVSGATDGRVILWDLCINKNRKMILEKIHEYVLDHGSPHCDLNQASDHVHDTYHVQSLCIGKEFILCGTKSGDIYELAIPKDTKQKNQIVHDEIRLRKRALDGEIVKNISFNSNSDKLITITQNGNFCVWNISTLNRIQQHNFNKQTINMVVCRRTTRIYIAFVNEILLLKNEIYCQENILQTHHILDNIHLTVIKLSYNEKILAVGLGAKLSENPRIEIFDVDNEDNQFKRQHVINDLSNKIEYMDISTDNFYLMFRDNMEEVVYINLDSYQKESNLSNNFDIEWSEDGIKFSEKTKGIESFYPQENNSNKVLKLSQNTMVVTDDMGTIRIFNYPYESQNIGFMRVYTNHLNFITQCSLSHDKHYLVTYSNIDRCILIWQNKINPHFKYESIHQPQSQHRLQNINSPCISKESQNQDQQKKQPSRAQNTFLQELEAEKKLNLK